MKNKKITKQLMAIGVQRNDAAAFARTYHKIVSRGRRDLFPELTIPAPPMVRTAMLSVQTLKVSILRHRAILYAAEASGACVDQYIRKKMAEELAQCLLSSPYVLYQQRDLLTGEREFTARIRVVEPAEGE